MEGRKRTKPDHQVQRIVGWLRQTYGLAHPKARIEAYRYNSACIWVRILDPDFARVKMWDRHDQIWEILVNLSGDTPTQVSLVFPLTPKEARTSQMNLLFEDHMPKWLRDEHANKATTSRKRLPRARTSGGNSKAKKALVQKRASA